MVFGMSLVQRSRLLSVLVTARGSAVETDCPRPFHTDGTIFSPPCQGRVLGVSRLVRCLQGGFVARP